MTTDTLKAYDNDRFISEEELRTSYDGTVPVAYSTSVGGIFPYSEADSRQFFVQSLLFHSDTAGNVLPRGNFMSTSRLYKPFTLNSKGCYLDISLCHDSTLDAEAEYDTMFAVEVQLYLSTSATSDNVYGSLYHRIQYITNKHGAHFEIPDIENFRIAADRGIFLYVKLAPIASDYEAVNVLVNSNFTFIADVDP